MRKPSDTAANKGLFKLDRTFGQMAVNMGEASWAFRRLATARRRCYA